MPIRMPGAAEKASACRRQAHGDQTGGVQHAADDQDAKGAPAIGERAGERAGEAPGEVLHRQGEGEGLAVPAAVGGDRLQQQAEAVADAHRHRHDRGAADQHLLQRERRSLARVHAAIGRLARSIRSIEVGSSFSRAAPTSPSSCAGEVALAIGAVMLGRAICQASATCAGRRAGRPGDAVERGEDRQAALVQILRSTPAPRTLLLEVGGAAVLAGEKAARPARRS